MTELRIAVDAALDALDGEWVLVDMRTRDAFVTAYRRLTELAIMLERAEN